MSDLMHHFQFKHNWIYT